VILKPLSLSEADVKKVAAGLDDFIAASTEAASARTTAAIQQRLDSALQRITEQQTAIDALETTAAATAAAAPDKLLEKMALACGITAQTEPTTNLPTVIQVQVDLSKQVQHLQQQLGVTQQKVAEVNKAHQHANNKKVVAYGVAEHPQGARAAAARHLEGVVCAAAISEAVRMGKGNAPLCITIATAAERNKALASRKAIQYRTKADRAAYREHKAVYTKLQRLGRQPFIHEGHLWYRNDQREAIMYSPTTALPATNLVVQGGRSSRSYLAVARGKQSEQQALDLDGERLGGAHTTPTQEGPHNATVPCNSLSGNVLTGDGPAQPCDVSPHKRVAPEGRELVATALNVGNERVAAAANAAVAVACDAAPQVLKVGNTPPPPATIQTATAAPAAAAMPRPPTRSQGPLSRVQPTTAGIEASLGGSFNVFIEQDSCVHGAVEGVHALEDAPTLAMHENTEGKHSIPGAD
jgi:hypothetical protein